MCACMRASVHACVRLCVCMWVSLSVFARACVSRRYRVPLLFLFAMFGLSVRPSVAACSWRIFKAIERNARVSTGGYSGLKNVDAASPSLASNKDDHMDSFFLAETLKYLVSGRVPTSRWPTTSTLSTYCFVWWCVQYLLFSETTLLPVWHKPSCVCARVCLCVCVCACVSVAESTLRCVACSSTSMCSTPRPIRFGYSTTTRTKTFRVVHYGYNTRDSLGS
jgi:hypothetical protein